MIRDQFILDIQPEIIVDNFAGGGGASHGIERALGRHVDVAINHDREAVAMHEANHPQTRHYCESVWDVDPLAVTQGRPVGLAWFSPDCKHFSKAKGGKPRDKRIRGLAWIVLRWADLTRPRVIALENVEEFQTWGRCYPAAHPARNARATHSDRSSGSCRRRATPLNGVSSAPATTGPRPLANASSCSPGVTAARSSGPSPHTAHQARPALRPASSSLGAPLPSALTGPCPARASLSAPARWPTTPCGIRRYVIEAKRPFVVDTPLGMVAPVMTEIANASSLRCMPADEPIRTICAETKGGHHALIAPTLIQTGYGERPGQAPRVPGLDKPLGTIVAGGAKHALVTAFLAKHFGGNYTGPGASLTDPMHTVTATDHHALVCAFLTKYYGEGSRDQSLEDPLHTIPTVDRFGLVTVEQQQYRIADIGMRMLEPHELYRAQGFPPDYITAPVVDGKPLTKRAQVRMCGNSVSPPLAAALVRANVPEMIAYTRREMEAA